MGGRRIPRPDRLIHYITFMGLQWRLLLLIIINTLKQWTWKITFRRVIAINKTCTLTSRSRLETYKRLVSVSSAGEANVSVSSRSREVSVSVSSWSRAFTSCAHPWYIVTLQVARDCADIMASGQLNSDIYTVHVNDNDFEVFCDMTTEGGGWLVTTVTSIIYFSLLFIRFFNFRALFGV